MNYFQIFLSIIIAYHVTSHIAVGGWLHLFGASFVAIAWLVAEWVIQKSDRELDEAYTMLDHYQVPDKYRGY